MADNYVQMQHASKASASFSHGGKSFDSDAAGIITIPSHLAGHAKSHGFSTEVTKLETKPLAKDAGAAKGGDGK
jgi:hypothetical protein